MCPLHPQDRNIAGNAQAHFQNLPHLTKYTHHTICSLYCHSCILSQIGTKVRFGHPASDEVWIVFLVLHNVDSIEDKVVLPRLERKSRKCISSQ